MKQGQTIEQRRKRQYYCYQEMDGWYFVNAAGKTWGPFTEIIDTVMGPWATGEEAISGEPMAAQLRPLVFEQTAFDQAADIPAAAAA